MTDLFLFKKISNGAAQLACEQAPRWGIGRNEKSASGAWYGGDKERKKRSSLPPFSPLLQARRFYLRPKPYLGACSQATAQWRYSGLFNIEAKRPMMPKTISLISSCVLQSSLQPTDILFGRPNFSTSPFCI